MNRRAFLQTIAACAAPMFIPASRLWLPPERPTITVYKTGPASRTVWLYHDDVVWGTTKIDGIVEWTGRVPVVSSRPWEVVFLDGGENAQAFGIRDL